MSVDCAKQLPLPPFVSECVSVPESVSTAGSTVEDGDANLSSTLLLPVILANIFEFYVLLAWL